MIRPLTKLLFCLVLALMTSSLAQEGVSTDGQEIYEAQCAVCHGAEGEGGVGPAHAGNAALADARYVVDTILHGKGEMPAFGGQLSNEQIAAVASYIRTSWGNDFGVVAPEEVEALRSGEQEGAEGEAQQRAEGETQAAQTSQQAGQPSGEREGARLDFERLSLEQVVEGLTSPVTLVSPPGDERRFIVDRIGKILILTPDGELLAEPFLDLSDRIVELREQFDERGLLGLAFHPNFAENGRFYVYYSAPLREEAPDNWDHTSHISEFLTTEPEDDAQPRGSSNTADPNTERILLKVDQPQFNHNAGAIAFGPDGLFYIALGDGGAANDVAMGHPPMGHGQDITSILGNILRIDVDRGWPGYAIPQDNPFVGTQGVDEIYAWGWRNPWRMSFDRSGNGDLFVATNGQNLWEAVYLVREPGNYGWNILEGTHCFDPQNPNETPPRDACPETGPQGEPLQLPVIEYPHPANQGDSDVAGTSVIGGYVYRGEAFPAWQGAYIFGDWSTSFAEPGGQVLMATPSATEGELWELEQLAQFEAYVLGFGEDDQGELYVLTTEKAGPTGNTGKVYKIVPPQEGQ